MTAINVTETSDFEGRKINVHNLNILPIFTKTSFDRVESFVKQDHEKYLIYKLIPEHTNVKDILDCHDGYVFVAHKDDKIFIRDIGGAFPVTPDLLKFMELVPSTES